MKRLAVIIFIVSAVILFLSIFAYNLNSRVLDEKIIRTSFTITDKTGAFDLNSSELSFGKVSLGGSETRKIIFTNPYKFPIDLLISADQAVDNFISYDKLIRIESYDSLNIPFTVFIPEDAIIGDYSGNITLKVKMARK